MSTPEEEPSIEDAIARARAAAQELAAALDEPPPWEPVRKRPRKPKSKAEKKRELRKQRRRLQDASRRRFAAGQSRRPRFRQNRIGSAAARPVPGAALHRLAVVTMPGIVHPVDCTMSCIRCTMPSIGWTPLGGIHPMGSTPVRIG